jgi:glycosyltransferase involved in cell wall biosynthesis
VLWALTRLGSTVHLVVHEATPRGEQGSVRSRVEDLLRTRARLISLSEHTAQLLGRQSSLCSHPPYAHWAAWAGVKRTDDDVRPRQVLVLGQIRPDKGLDQLPGILRSLPTDVAASTTLVVAGKGALPNAAELAQLVTLDDRSGDEFLEDAELASLLETSGVLLAPYVGASQSGTVLLALTVGLPVIAYDSGAISDVVPATHCAPLGDQAVLGELLADALRDGLSAPSVQAWAARAEKQWQSVLRP